MKRAAKYIRPWSSFTSADATAGNFPCLKHFFPCEDGAGTYRLRDVVGGVEYVSHTWASSADYSIKTTYADDATGHNQALAAGAWNLDRSKKTLLLMCASGVGSLGAIGVGDSVSGEELMLSKTFYLSIATSQSQYPEVSGGPSVSTPGVGALVDNAVPSIYAGKFDPGVDIVGIYTDGTGNAVEQTPVALTSIPLLPAFENTYSLPAGSSLTALYGIAIFQFVSSFPTDVQQAVEWMRAEWARGHKAIYPGWVGKS